MKELAEGFRNDLDIVKKIVVCDDHQDICDLIRIVFEKKGHQVISFNTLQSVDQILNEDPDLVLLDLNMPGMDGRKLTRELKSRNKELQVTLISGDRDVEMISDELNVAFLMKPFSVVDLLGLLSEAS